MKNGILNRIINFLFSKEGGRRLSSLFLIIGVVLALVMGFYLVSLKYNPNVTSSTESIIEATTTDMFPWEDVEIDGDSVDIIGCWFEPHGASHNIVFDSDTSFVYHTFIFPSKGTHVALDIKGKCQREGIKLKLMGDDEWESTMYIRHNGTNFFLSNSIKSRGIYLVKSSE